MNYTVPYSGTFCSKTPVKRKRTLSPEAKVMRDFYRSHKFSVEVKSDGTIIEHIVKLSEK